MRFVERLDGAQSRDNHFNLIRLLAALAVLASHCYPLATGRAELEPFMRWLGMSLGAMAVDVFFVVSGFLVTGSLLTAKDLRNFVAARVLRIFPALCVAVVLTVFLLGPLFTTLGLREYLASSLITQYLAHCMSLLFGVVYELPGVFASNPFKGAVNGSLWTLPFELYMYIGLLFMWWLLRRWAMHAARAMAVVVALIALASLLVTVHGHEPKQPIAVLAELIYCFAAGSLFYLMRARVALSPGWMWGGVALLLLGATDKRFFYIAYLLAMPGLVLYLAYAKQGAALAYNRVGDYSYGVYIYAFPVQQSVAALWPGITPLGLFALAAPTTLLLAVLSWQLVERRALRLKPHFGISR